ncbi:DegV family protein [Thermotoga neapolitana DSM 4359]|uniref:DegV family protein n=1 Tax=Thermotoga neapolitana (strain ATCC 49049 / DSM 4359 / NBRC 107923 / NS-E) TaxID=309803 RepID=B9K7U3_THENN|nr:DegV family protein [Thermotoga neapolitana DSM 4359]
MKTVGIKVYIDDREFTDGVDLDSETFYSFFGRAKDFRTAVPSPVEMEKVLRDIISEGYTRIYCVHLSAKLSAFYSVMNGVVERLEEEFPDVEFKVIDTRQVSIGAGYVLLELMRAVERGEEDLETVVENVNRRIKIRFSVLEFNYLIKSGRVRATVGILGNLAKIFPIMSLENGELKVVAKKRGLKNVVEKIVEDLKTEKPRMLGLAYAGEEMKEIVLELKARLQDDKVERVDIVRLPPTLAVHSGPKMFGAGILTLE